MPTTPIIWTTCEIVSHRCKTNTVSNTAFRGFGGPQGMVGIEHVVDEIARHLHIDPLTVRKRNFYGTRDRNITPYHMTIEDNVIAELVAELEPDAGYSARRKAVDRVQCRQPLDQARPGADTGQVRHFVHPDAHEPGRRAGARLHRRQRRS